MNNDKLICKICSREFTLLRGLAYHIKIIHNMESKDYYDLYIKSNNDGMCKICGNITRYCGLKEGYCKYCSPKCSNQDPDVKNILKIKLKKWANTIEGKKSLSESGKKLKGYKRDLKFHETASKRQKGKPSWNKGKSNVLSKESLDKMSKAQLKRFSNPCEIEKISKSHIGIKMSNTHREKQRNRMLNGHAIYMLSFSQTPSKPQITLFNLVKEIHSTAEMEYYVKEVNKCIDIVIKEYMIAIEYDGSYWHKDKLYDDKRQKSLEKLGWKFIRYVDYIPKKEELIYKIEE